MASSHAPMFCPVIILRLVPTLLHSAANDCSFLAFSVSEFLVILLKSLRILSSPSSSQLHVLASTEFLAVAAP
ncbi:hypothetical protein B0H17DRAFT_1059399, partial [Mycena rosella]